MLSRTSPLNPRVKVYEDVDIHSPRAKTETASNYDRLDHEENDRMVESRKGTIESEKPSSSDYDAWLTWTRPQAAEMVQADAAEAQKRAHYRLAVLDQAEESWAPCLTHLNKVVELDPDFCKSQVALRIAEASYKLGDVDAAFKSMAQAEPDLRVADKYMLHLLKGKCYDRQRQFKRAVLEYGQAIELA